MKPSLTVPILVLCFGLGLVQEGSVARAADADGWVALFDGQSLAGWKAAENPGSFVVQDGAIMCTGPRAHLFYTGQDGKAAFKNFELKATVKTTPGADSGIYFHTQYQPEGFPRPGRQVQIQNTPGPAAGRHAFCKTGSLLGVRNQYKSIVADNQWFTLNILVEGDRTRISVDQTLLVDYTQPAGTENPAGSENETRRGPSEGTFALQCHGGPGSVCVKEIQVRPLPDEAAVAAGGASTVDAVAARLDALQRKNFPLVDFHVHLKGGLTVDEALANSRRTGIFYGIAPNCGVNFPITDDAGIDAFLAGMKGRPVFLGMQAEGREWVRLFSREAIAKFDYVFTDAMTFTDQRGKRVRLWMNDEVVVDDEQAFMDMYVEKIRSVLGEPIDIYVNPTFLPECIAPRYDALWTEDRMEKVIEVAARNGVAIEINARYRIPSVKFIQRAKAAGVKFSCGTNNGDKDLGRLEYCLDVIDQCGLTADDMFMPRPKH